MKRTMATQEDALDEAAAWIARLRAGDVSERERFAAWLAADTRNAPAFDRMLDLWSDLGVLRALSAVFPRGDPERA